MTARPHTDAGLSLSLLGLMMTGHRFTLSQDPGFLALRDRLAEADVRVGDLLSVIQDGSDWAAHAAGAGRSGTFLHTPPSTVEELGALGIDAVLTASSHAVDFGEGGVLTNLRYLDEAGIAHAGTGRSLTEATAPAYVDTPRGRLAIICASDWGPRNLADLPAPTPTGALAADGSALWPPRPGVNLIRFKAIHHVDRATVDALRTASAALGWDAAKEARRQGGGRNLPMSESMFDDEVDTDDSVYFMGTRFVVDGEFGFETVPYRADLERNYRWIDEARRQADYVLVVLHQHGAERAPGDPADHLRIFAHGAIDHGADVVARSATLAAGGVEIYRGKPVIYGLTSFVLQPGQLTAVPPEAMQQWGLSPERDTPSDWLDARDRAEQEAIGVLRERLLGQNAVIHTVLFDDDGAVDRIELTPIEFTDGSRPRLGQPRLASPDSPAGQRTLATMAERSAVFGTTVEIENGVGVIRLSTEQKDNRTG